MWDLLSLLLLLGIANGVPVLAAKLFGQRFDTPVDVGCRFVDGRPLFGASKTIRGIVFSLLATSLAAPMLGFAWTAGALLAAGAMVGDLASSFLKRRMGLPIHAQASGLDQILEAGLPLLLLRRPLDLSWLEIAALVSAFVVLEVVLSPVLYRLGVRDRPH
jgi:CDP-archaeol synthase